MGSRHVVIIWTSVTLISHNVSFGVINTNRVCCSQIAGLSAVVHNPVKQLYPVQQSVPYLTNDKLCLICCLSEERWET